MNYQEQITDLTERVKNSSEGSLSLEIAIAQLQATHRLADAVEQLLPSNYRKPPNFPVKEGQNDVVS